MNVSRRALLWIGGAAMLAAAALAVAVAIAIDDLRARPGQWRVPLSLWHRQFDASGPALVRWGTHPFAARVLDGRSFRTRTGRWTFSRAGNGGLAVACAPCALRLAALGPEPIVIQRAQFVGHARDGDRFDGVLRFGAVPGAVTMRWGAVSRSDSLRVHAELAPTPLGDLIALVGDSVPEVTQARIGGHIALVLAGRINDGGVQLDVIEPRFTNVSVSGLGTEALLDADAPSNCQPQPAQGRIIGWLPHAVIAAEDQRFHEHAGFEPDAWLAIWKRNTREPEAPHGASTITQQLAKILFTGDERTAARKLREWLYAVEMERTLGKARILQLYLATAPWGEGICGAEAAARRYLRKPTHLVKPHEAAWLASLLVNPERQLQRWREDDSAARERALRVLQGMRKLPVSRRRQELATMATWQPRGSTPTSVSAPAAQRGSLAAR